VEGPPTKPSRQQPLLYEATPSGCVVGTFLAARVLSRKGFVVEVLSASPWIGRPCAALATYCIRCHARASLLPLLTMLCQPLKPLPSPHQRHSISMPLSDTATSAVSLTTPYNIMLLAGSLQCPATVTVHCAQTRLTVQQIRKLYTFTRTLKQVNK